LLLLLSCRNLEILLAREEQEKRKEKRATATMSPAPAVDQDYKSSLLSLLVANNALAFGTFTLKSGRESPYFLTSSRLYTAPLLRQTSASFANVISAPPFVSVGGDGAITPNFDIVFGYFGTFSSRICDSNS
jgi:hypothetical protein